MESLTEVDDGCADTERNVSKKTVKTATPAIKTTLALSNMLLKMVLFYNCDKDADRLKQAKP
jgi:hypothetical protein